MFLEKSLLLRNTHPNPLDSEWNSITPLRSVIDKTLEDSGREKLTNRPTKIHEVG